MEWETSCFDWRERILQGRSIIPAPLFQDQADRGLSILRELRIVDAPGSPTIGEACAPWVFDLVASICGAYDEVSGRRLITEWFVCVPKKNSKSTIAAAVMLTMLIMNWRMSAEFSIIAPTIEVSKNSYFPARDMIRVDDELIDLMQVQDHLKTIKHVGTGAMLQVLAADANTLGGKKSVGILVDELWLFGKKADAENMLREATGGLASRPEGFIIWLTTQSDEPPAGVFKQKLQYARDVRDGKIIDKQFVPIIYELPEDMVKSKSYLDPENMKLVNPNLGYSVDELFLTREFAKAQNSGEESIRGFLAKHANVEIGLNLRSDRWMGADYWERCGDKRVTMDYIIDNSEVIDIGIDGGGLDDLLGMSVIGRHKESKCWLIWCHAWAHPSVRERRKDIVSNLIDFNNEGDVTFVDQIGDDITDVADIVTRIYKSELLDKVGVDPAGIGGILDALIDAGLPEDMVIGISQGWKMSGSIKTLERKLAETGAAMHAASPLMAWCVGNAKIVPVGNAINITKQVSGSAKIDPLMATFNAVALMSANPSAKKQSVYEHRGIRFV